MYKGDQGCEYTKACCLLETVDTSYKNAKKEPNISLPHDIHHQYWEGSFTLAFLLYPS